MSGERISPPQKICLIGLATNKWPRIKELLACTIFGLIGHEDAMESRAKFLERSRRQTHNRLMGKSEPIEPAKMRAGWHPFRWFEWIDRVESESFRRVIQSIMSAIIGAAILGTIAYVWTQREWLIGSSESASQFIWNLLQSPIQLKLWILFLIAVAVIWIMYLLRGRKKGPESLAALKISASMQLRHTDKKRILLVVDVLNMASKTAFIKKVAVILPRLTLTAVDNPSIQFSPETSELVAFQNPRIIEIKPDGGLITWEIVLGENLRYGIDEKGEKIGKGYVELTSGEKLGYHYSPLPDSAWETLNAPIAPVFDGKTGHKCSQCGTVSLVPIDAVTAICHDCQHIDRLKPRNPSP